MPRESWADRILAAKHAGFNTVETPIVWNRHEPRPGKFDFTGENDLRHFVDLAGKAGMYVILGLGPYVGAGWDFGGLPAWLRETAGAKLRANSAPFLEASSRFFSAVADQVKGWQVTAPGSGGPIVLFQLESGWTCGHDQLGGAYLGELTRYVREAGLNVPIINANNMWQSVEGQVDGWSGAGPMIGTMRQLASVRPEQPRMVIDMNFAPSASWGEDHAEVVSGRHVQRRLAEVCAGGAQFNLTSFCGGTNMGFFGGRSGEGTSQFFTSSTAHGHLLDEFGTASRELREVRKIALAASRFGRVFANLDPAYQPVSGEPAGAKGRGGAVAVLHASGSQGGVAFVFGGDPGAARPERIEHTLVLPNGSSMPVPLMSNAVAWCFFDVNVSGRSRLDYANVSALGAVGQVLVMFGPAGGEAIISIDGSPVEATIPEDDAEPALLQHEGLAIVLVNDEQAGGVYFTDDAVLVGVDGVTPAGAPVLGPGRKGYVRVNRDGVLKSVHAEGPSRRARGERVVISPWTTAGQQDYLDGSSARFAVIAGPSDLSALGCPFGYGWYRLSPKAGASGKAHASFPNAGDRLHVYAEGRLLDVVGVGPGAAESISLPLRSGHPLVVLAENLGRFSDGASLGEPKGLFGEAYEVSQVRPGKPSVETGAPLDVLAFRAPLWELSEGDATSPDRVTWHLPSGKKHGVVMWMNEPPAGALLVVNEKTIAFVDRSGPRAIVIGPDHLSKGKNTVQLALVTHGRAEDEARRLAGLVRFEQIESELFAGMELAFARWEPPAPGAYSAKPAPHAAGTPAWHRCTFTANPADGPLWLEPHGMTKGQVFVNGRHLCRYFVATATGKRVPPQERYVVPASWFKADAPNELVVFDEHGGHPVRCRLGR